MISHILLLRGHFEEDTLDPVSGTSDQWRATPKGSSNCTGTVSSDTALVACLRADVGNTSCSSRFASASTFVAPGPFSQ